MLYCYCLLWPNRIRDTFMEWRYGPNGLISCVFSYFPSQMDENHMSCHWGQTHPLGPFFRNHHRGKGTHLRCLGLGHCSSSRFGRQYSRRTHLKLWFETEGCHWDCQTIKVKVASESESDLHIRTIGIGQESAHKHIQLRRNTFHCC